MHLMTQHIPEDLNFHVYGVTSSKLRSYEFTICFLWQVIQTLINFGSEVIIQIHEWPFTAQVVGYWLLYS